MSLSKQYLSSHAKPLRFDVGALAEALKSACPEVFFALLLGSSRDGQVAVGSDLDLARNHLDDFRRFRAEIDGAAR